MKDFRQELYENGYFRQEELCFADCDRYQRARVSGLLNKAAAYAGYDYNARGLTHDVLFEMGEVFLLSRLAMRIHQSPWRGRCWTSPPTKTGSRARICSGSTR